MTPDTTTPSPEVLARAFKILLDSGQFGEALRQATAPPKPALPRLSGAFTGPPSLATRCVWEAVSFALEDLDTEGGGNTIADWAAITLTHADGRNKLWAWVELLDAYLREYGQGGWGASYSFSEDGLPQVTVCHRHVTSHVTVTPRGDNYEVRWAFVDKPELAARLAAIQDEVPK